MDKELKMENIQAQNIKSTEEIDMEFSNYGKSLEHENSDIFIKEELISKDKITEKENLISKIIQKA